MGRTSDFELSIEQHNQLIGAREAAKKAKDYKRSVRIRAVLLLGSHAKKREEVAEICETGVSTIYLWQRRYQKFGLEGLIDQYKPRPCRLSEAQQNELAAVMEEGPEASGFDTGIWTSPLVGKVIKERYGIVYSVSAIARLLHRLNFSVQLPQVQLARADPAAQAKWSNEDYPAIQKRAEEAGGVVFFSKTKRSSSSRAPGPGRGRGWVKGPS